MATYNSPADRTGSHDVRLQKATIECAILFSD
jgi:hypothetical protein